MRNKRKIWEQKNDEGIKGWWKDDERILRDKGMIKETLKDEGNIKRRKKRWWGTKKWQRNERMMKDDDRNVKG